MNILFDTNTLIQAMAGQEPWASLMKKAIIEKTLVTSPIVLAEYLIKSTLEEENIVIELYDRVRSIPITNKVAQVAAHIRRSALVKKQRLYLPDSLIAAQCIVGQAKLVTLNHKDFPKDIIHSVTPYND